MSDELFGGATDERAFPAELEAEYEVVRELGRGGMAVVYLARDRELRREVAIKVVQAQYTANAEVVARFAREARTVAGLNHPNIVTLYSVRKLTDGSLALIMQYVPGETLQQAVERDGAFSFGRARQILADVAHALAYAHARGIVHRDVKPENVFIDMRTGRALLSDFGIARSAELDPRVTRTNVAIGTPAYMSPEQIDGASIDGRSDLYSLGLVGWEMLTGQQPWQGEGLYNVIYKQKHDDLPPLDEVRRETPPELVAAVEGALEKDPNVRWAHADDFLDVLTGRVPPPPRRRRRTGHSPVTTADFTLPPELINSPTVEWRRGEPSVPPAPIVPPPPLVDEPVSRGGDEPAVSRPAPPPGPYRTRRVPDPRPARRRRAVLAVLLVAGAVTAGVLTVQRDRTTARRPAAVAVDQPTTVAVQVRPESAAGAIVSPPPPPPASLPTPTTDSAVQLPGAATPQPGAPAPDTVAADVLPPLLRVGPPTQSTITTTETAIAPESSGTPATGPLRTGAAGAGGGDSQPAALATPTAPTSDVVLVTSSNAAATLAPGGSHTCEITADSTALCWGANGSGQLGTGTTERRMSPTPTASDQRFVSISAGLGHTCAVAAGGSAYCWGGNDRGQLGDGTRIARTTPVRVAGLSRVRTVESASLHSCALTVGGEAYCWGANPYGELGVSGGALSRPSPVRVPSSERFTLLALGWNHTCALTSARGAVCWGQNSSGQLGSGAPSERGGVTPVVGGLQFVSLAAGSAHSCGVTTDGAAYCWGGNTNGQLGDGSTMERAAPSRVAGDARFVRVTAGSVHSCALTGSGEAYCWGRNLYGQLGDGTRADRTTPVRVESREPFVALRASGSHTCGTTASRRNVCWGYNLDGQLGDGTRTHRGRPVPVSIGS